jgi:hypothetical protein
MWQYYKILQEITNFITQKGTRNLNVVKLKLFKMITAPQWSRIMQVVFYKFIYLTIVKIELFLFFASPNSLPS